MEWYFWMSMIGVTLGLFAFVFLGGLEITLSP